METGQSTMNGSSADSWKRSCGLRIIWWLLLWVYDTFVRVWQWFEGDADYGAENSGALQKYPGKPPRQVPVAHWNEFTQFGEIPVEYWYFDSRTTPWDPWRWLAPVISKLPHWLSMLGRHVLRMTGWSFLSSSSSGNDWRPKVFTKKRLDAIVWKVDQGVNFHDWYLDKEIQWFRDAVEKQGGFAGKTVLVVGSTEPSFEAFSLAKGARKVFVSEYHPLLSEHPDIIPVQPQHMPERGEDQAEWYRDTYGVDIDIIICFSSIEHDGLGRYGDPISPDADLRSMEQMKASLKPGGLLYLAVPVGQDLLVWNAHRIYGRKRLPKLVAGWTIIGHQGFTPNTLDAPPGNYHPWVAAPYMCNPQPTLVLSKEVSSSTEWSQDDQLAKIPGWRK